MPVPRPLPVLVALPLLVASAGLAVRAGCADGPGPAEGGPLPRHGGTPRTVEAPAAAPVATPRKMIGAVDIPSFLTAGAAAGDALALDGVRLFASPGDPEPIREVRDPARLERVGISLEHAAAAVYGTRYETGAAWFLVKLLDPEEASYAWLGHEQAGDYRTLREILLGRLAYLTDAWDGDLYRSPDPAAPRQRFEGLGDHPDVAVASARWPAGEQWLLVVLLDGSPCGDGTESVKAAGWVPAHAADGRLTVWHYPGGC